MFRELSRDCLFHLIHVILSLATVKHTYTQTSCLGTSVLDFNIFVSTREVLCGPRGKQVNGGKDGGMVGGMKGWREGWRDAGGEPGRARPPLRPLAGTAPLRPAQPRTPHKTLGLETPAGSQVSSGMPGKLFHLNWSDLIFCGKIILMSWGKKNTFAFFPISRAYPFGSILRNPPWLQLCQGLLHVSIS